MLLPVRSLVVLSAPVVAWPASELVRATVVAPWVSEPVRATVVASWVSEPMRVIATVRRGTRVAVEAWTGWGP